ncbi:MAG: type II toxin-antitoxin system RelE/ParE family toxin [Planctomycetes bacterium]|nr:type II toxin-antitoxin system RelE/ParE family toxin [Planctomycetota bacterium]
MLPVEVFAGATEQADAAVVYLEQRSPRTADRFRQILRETLQKLGQFPHLGIESRYGTRLLILPKFRYRIFYLVKAEHITVIGIYHPAQSTHDLFDRLHE